MPNSYVRKRAHYSSVTTTALLTWLLVLLPHRPASSQTLSIGSEEGFISLRPCVQRCLSKTALGEDIASNLECDYPYYNVCFCREDLATQALSFLTKCVSSSCNSAAADLPQAASLYNKYCSRDNVPNSNVAVVTLESSVPTSTVVAVTTVTSGATGGTNSPATLAVDSGYLPMLMAALVLAFATLVLSLL
jgi:hypothetical protein